MHDKGFGEKVTQEAEARHDAGEAALGGGDCFDLDRQKVARLGALDIDRTCHWMDPPEIDRGEVIILCLRPDLAVKTVERIEFDDGSRRDAYDRRNVGMPPIVAFVRLLEKRQARIETNALSDHEEAPLACQTANRFGRFDCQFTGPSYPPHNLKRIAEIQRARALLRLADWAKIVPHEALPSLPMSSEKARYALAIELGPARSNREPQSHGPRGCADGADPAVGADRLSR